MDSHRLLGSGAVGLANGAGATDMTTEIRLHYGRFVDLEDDLVIQPAGKNRRVYWVQCPTCGPQPPKTAIQEPWTRHAIVSHTNTTKVASCSVCGQDSPYKEILIPRERRRRNERCTNRCLNGKVYCACGCAGRCHGEGVCYCKEGSDA